MALIFHLPSQITHKNIEAVLADGLVAINACETNGCLTVGCESLEFFDSSALSAILSMKRHARQKNISIVLQSIPEKLASLAKVYGVADVVLV
jgi:phospholipid transport system transporter-binding protein